MDFLIGNATKTCNAIYNHFLQTKYKTLKSVYFILKRKLCFAVATRITFICPMTFNSFPLDVQVCLFQVSAVVMQVVMIVFITNYSRLDLSTTTTPRWSSMTPL